MSISSSFPSVRPALLLDFIRSNRLDPRITFTRASGATRVNHNGLIETVGNHVPRFDYDPVTGACLGLLIEPARTNSFLQSAFASNWTFNAYGSWGASGPAPDGTNSARIFSDLDLSTAGYVYQAVSVISGSVYCISCYVKPINGARLALYNWTQAGSAIFDISSGVVTFQSVTGTFTNGVVKNAGNGWYRISATYTANATGAVNMGISTYLNAQSGDLYYLWGMQLEAGEHATSYIPTTTTAVLRELDLAVIYSAYISNIIKMYEGTFDLSFDFTGYRKASSGFYRMLTAQTADVTDIRMTTSLSGGKYYPYLGVTVDNVSQGSPGAGTVFDPDTTVHVAGSWKDNLLLMANGGVTATADTSATLQKSYANALYLGCDYGASHMIGHLKRVAYYDFAADASQLAYLSRP
jgi:hypothetical protein